MKRSLFPGQRTGRPYMMAVVLGTALTTGFSPAVGAAQEQQAPMSAAVADISRYCTACWRNARLPVDTWSDCTQEVLCRLLQRVPQDSWGAVLSPESEERKEFVRAIDTVKKRAQRARKPSAHLPDALPDQRVQHDAKLTADRALVGDAAAEVLSARQQQILQLALQGWSVHEIGTKLGAPPERVSDEKYKAIRKLRTYLQERDAT